MIRTNGAPLPFPKGPAFMKIFWQRLLSVPDTDLQSPPVFFSCLPTLETGDLILRRPRMKDAADIYAYASDERVARYVLWEPHRSLAETRSCLRDLIRRARAGYPSSWVITLKNSPGRDVPSGPDGRVIGTIGFIWYSAENSSAEIGYSLSADYWNRGYATQALQAVSAEAFRSLPLNRLEAQHDLRNPASGRVMEKSGFRREGILRSRVFNKGEYADVALYSLLRSDLRSPG